LKALLHPDEDNDLYPDTPAFRENLQISSAVVSQIKTSLDAVSRSENLASAQLAADIADIMLLHEKVEDADKLLVSSTEQQQEEAQLQHTQQVQSEAQSQAEEKTDISLMAWTCPKCSTINSMLIDHCTNCQLQRSQQVVATRQPKSWADSLSWTCSKCSAVNHLSLTECPLCKNNRPDFSKPSPEMMAFREAEKSKWRCPKCNILNDNSSPNCLMCSSARPK